MNVYIELCHTPCVKALLRLYQGALKAACREMNLVTLLQVMALGDELGQHVSEIVLGGIAERASRTVLA
jgi:hypothetical protein